MDDLEPVPHACHAAIVRSQLAHARITVDASAALGRARRRRRPHRRGRGVAVAALPRRNRVAGVALRGRRRHGSLRRRAARGRRRAGPLPRRGRGRARRRRLRAARARRRARRPRMRPRPPLPLRRRRRRPRRRRPRRPRDASACRASRARRSSATASSATGTSRPGRLTAWANFQGPFTLHGVAAAALGLRGDRLRLLTPPDSGGSFGIKSSVLAYVVLVGLAARTLGVPVRWTEDRLEHLAASAAATGRVTELEAGFTREGELVALRYDALEDVGAYVRAPEPATLYRMHGSLSGAYRVRNVAARNRVVLTNTLPSGLNRGFGGPQLYFGLERTMAIAARRLGIDPAELARRNLVRAEEMPYRTPTGGLYDSGDYAACLDRRARARALRRASRRGRGGAGRGQARRHRSRMRRRAVDLEHGLHHARADGGRAGGDPAEVGKRRGRVRGDRPAGRDHRPARDDAAGPGAPHRRRPGRRGRARLRARRGHRRLRARHREHALDGGVGQLLLALLGRRGRRRPARGPPRAGEDRRRPRAPRRARLVAPEGCGHRALASRRAARRDGAGPHRGGVLRDAEPRPAGRRGPRRLVGSARLRRRRLRGRDRSGHRCRARHRLHERPRRRHPPEPDARRRSGSRRVRPRRRRRAVRAACLRRGREPHDGVARRLRDADRARSARPRRRPPGVALAVHPARSEGPRRRGDDVGAGRDRERRRRRARRRRGRAAADAAAGLAPGQPGKCTVSLGPNAA